MPTTNNSEKNRKYQRDWYLKNRTLQMQRNEKRKQEIREWFRIEKLKCLVCDEAHPACLDFHHRNPEDKRFNLSEAAAHGSSSKIRLRDEMDKCDILCSNCHRKLHYDERCTNLALSTTQ